MKIEAGKSYRTRNGVKVSQTRESVGHEGGAREMWMGSDGNCRYTDGKYPNRVMDGLDIIAEWKDAPMVQMQQGQEYKRRDGARVTQRKEAALGGKWCGNDGHWRNECGKSSRLDLPMDIIAEWPSEPEGKGAAEDKPEWGPWEVVADHPHNSEISEWECLPDGKYYIHYRKGPVKGTVTLTGNVGSGFDHSGWGSENDTHNLTLPTTDGTPITGTYTNAAGDVIELEEIGNA